MADANASPSPSTDGYGPQFLMIPGPTPVADRVRIAMGRQSVDFSGDAFIQCADNLFENLRPVFRDAHQVFLYAANGHAAWEAALSNTVEPGDAVLLPETGLFSEAWRGMASALGVDVIGIAGDWRHGVRADEVREKLAADVERKIKAVLIVHTDTAGSVTTDLNAIRSAIDDVDHPALLMVDAIASLCTTDLSMTRTKIDVTIAASQKGLGVPPGLSICAVSERAMAISDAVKTPRYYWSWPERTRGEHYKRFCGTAPEQLVFALTEAVTMLQEEGLDQCVARHQHLADMVRAAVAVWCEGGALEFNAVNPDERANSVTTVRTPDGFDAERIRTALRERHNVIVGGGLGNLRGSIFRIGHMGHINLPYVLGCLGAIDVELKSLGLAVGNGAIDAALAVAGEQR